jgi:hypothetical protein
VAVVVGRLGFTCASQSTVVISTYAAAGRAERHRVCDGQLIVSTPLNRPAATAIVDRFVVHEGTLALDYTG